MKDPAHPAHALHHPPFRHQDGTTRLRNRFCPDAVGLQILLLLLISMLNANIWVRPVRVNMEIVGVWTEWDRLTQTRVSVIRGQFLCSFCTWEGVAGLEMPSLQQLCLPLSCRWRNQKSPQLLMPKQNWQTSSHNRHFISAWASLFFFLSLNMQQAFALHLLIDPFWFVFPSTIKWALTSVWIIQCLGERGVGIDFSLT